MGHFLYDTMVFSFCKGIFQQECALTVWGNTALGLQGSKPVKMLFTKGGKCIIIIHYYINCILGENAFYRN